MKTCSVADCDKHSERQRMCQMHFWRLKHKGDVNYVPYKPILCSVDGCEKIHKGNGYCQMHLHRHKMNLPMIGPVKTLAPKRYKVVCEKGHPIAGKDGRIYQHRKVLYNAIGPVPVPCFWCGKRLIWGENLVVDHLDHDRHNNSLENLVPSCSPCNSGRMIGNTHTRVSIYSDGTVVGS